MGGNIFPQTTRISPADYALLKSSLTAVLTTFFAHAHAHTPLEAPSKPSHGDIDFLVLSPLPNSAQLAVALNAKASLIIGPTTHFAIPYTSVSGEARFAQLDVHLCRSQTQLEWLAFRNAHGVGGAVLGAFVRPLGMVLSDDGLYVELSARKKDRVLLSDRPGEVLRFVGLDAERWFSAFDSEQELYRYLATCRLLGTVAGAGRRESGVEKRPLFSGFWEYVRERDAGVELDGEVVRREAVEFFGRKEEYERVRAEVEADERELEAERLIKELVMQKTDSKDVPNLVVRALRRWCTLHSGILAVKDEVEMDLAKQMRLGELMRGSQLRVEVQDWLDEHWLEIRSKERTRAKNEKAARSVIATTTTSNDS